jgi:photosystem II stability/assembly factor-like uncharacterized protein
MHARGRILVAWLALALPAAAQWQIQNSSPAVNLRGLSVVNSRVVWASGAGGTYLRTTDGGATWSAATVPNAGNLDFRGVVAFDTDTTLLMSSGPAEQGQARIFKTRDAGQSWTQVFHSETKGMFLDAIAFWDRQRGLALSDPVGGRFVILATTDGGDTWKPMPADAMPPALPNEGAFAASNSCLVVAGSDAWFATGGAGAARVFHSRDGGRTWTVATTPVKAATASFGVFSLAFRDARNGIAVGGDYQNPAAAAANIALTSDGGRNWKPASAPLYLSGVAYVPGTPGREMIAVGSAGWAQSSDAGRSWTAHTDRGFNAVAFSPDGAGWAVGAKGVIAKYKPPTLKVR